MGDHFDELRNRLAPLDYLEIEFEDSEELEDDCSVPLKKEIRDAICLCQSSISCGLDRISAEILKLNQAKPH
ncbi:unnamed protein product [Soboliphyme baturini]|uniref:Uncharacterized protein n=1 Tax=Soboliphyme baturini TaxID=241478 RepID=A0A183IH05_9BILA|nr:unnamed protein product [Soboliphyme baturini]